MITKVIFFLFFCGNKHYWMNYIEGYRQKTIAFISDVLKNQSKGFWGLGIHIWMYSIRIQDKVLRESQLRKYCIVMFLLSKESLILINSHGHIMLIVM